MSVDYERPPKRRKVSNDDAEVIRRITSTNDLHTLLEFTQSTDLLVRTRLIAFKDHLASIGKLESTAEQSKQYQILKEYCQWQKATSEEQLDFHDILSTWSFAVDNNADGIVSAVTSALAQFLKTIGGSLELRQFGLALIDSLLRRDQSKLFEKCLAAPKSRPHLASPCLRLLTEIVSFDAGTRADQFWYRRDLFLHRFEIVLDPLEPGQDGEDRKKPSVRRMALRLVVAMLKHLNATAKADFLFQGRALHSCLKGLVHDGDDIVIDVLRAIEQYLVNDSNVSRSALVRFFNPAHLESLADLYNFELDENDEAKDRVRATVHDLLLKLCTTQKGIVLSQHGWYPPSARKVNVNMHEDYIDLGMDSPFYFDDYKDKIPVVNTTLAAFVQQLRPYEDDLQSALLLSIFREVRELVAEYFSRRRQLRPANTDDAQWRAQFAFILAVIDSAVPVSFGAGAEAQSHGPPPVTIAVESVLPRALDRSYLTKMLTSEDEILQISSARLATQSLRKLEKVNLQIDKHASANTYLWQQASARLSEAVEGKLPSLREVSTALQKSQGRVRAVLLECLLAYHTVLPITSSATTFDIGPLISSFCKSLLEDKDDTDSILDQLATCVQIAETSPSTRWLHKSDNDTLSPTSEIFQVCLKLKSSEARNNVLRTIRTVMLSKGIIDCGEQTFPALCSSLIENKKFSPSPELFNFFDNCIVRANLKPVKYVDVIEHASQMVSDRKTLSLFVGAIPEQWTIFVKRHEGEKKIMKSVAMWIARLFSLLDTAGENYRIMMHFQQDMLKSCEGKPREYFEDALGKMRKKPVAIDEQYQVAARKKMEIVRKTEAEDKHTIARDEMQNKFDCIIPMPDSLQGLDKWPLGFDVELEITTKRLQRLILCLASPDDEIRLQANQTVQQLNASLDNGSDYEGTQQICLILGELSETLKQSDLSRPLPAIVPVIANALLEVAVQPQHTMFPKVNKFLLRRPSWTAKGVIHYWMDHILRRPTEGDEEDEWNKEREWLLEVLLAGLRNVIDLDLFRKTNVWEHLLSLYASPCLFLANKKLILALLWRCANIEHGADMLWTRFGVHSWLEAVGQQDTGLQEHIDVLQAILQENCNSDMIEEWKMACKATSKNESDQDLVMVSGDHAHDL